MKLVHGGQSGIASANARRRDDGAATNTGAWSAATNTGNRSAASVEGEHSVAMASGYKSKARASAGSAIVLCLRDDEGRLLKIRSAIAGQDGIKPDTWYTLGDDGEFVEADGEMEDL